MATTTNYGWTTPDDTALVKDGAAAIRTLGTSIDTTTKNLNPSTTLGDIEYRSSTANTNTRLGIGSTGNILTVAGGVPTWAAPAGGSTSYTLLTSTTTTGVSSITLSFTACSDLLFQVIQTSSEGIIDIRFNGDSTTKYDDFKANLGQSGGTGFSMSTANSAIRTTSSRNGDETGFTMIVNGANKAGSPTYYGQSYFSEGGGTRATRTISGIYTATTAAITSITISNAAAVNFTAMTAKVYGRA
jgi:hypothetical protein